MADWFKFYENDLDETRLQYAISKLPEVVSVWVGLLSECCRHKCCNVSWGKDEIELFGFSRRLNISIPKVNEAVNILREIRYIAIEENHISVIKWDKKQSEYCQKLTKQQNQAGDQNPNSKKTPDSVPTVSRQCPDSVGQEERRGEEKRVEENKQREREAALPEIPPMSRKAFDDLCKMRAVPADCAEWFWNTHDGRNWTDKTGQPIRKVEPLLLNALNNWRAKQSQQSAQSQPSGKPTVFALTKIMEAKKQRADDLKSRHAIETGLDTTWNDPKARAEWKALRAEIKTLNLQMSQMA